MRTPPAPPPRARAAMLVILVWAGIFLPGLGALPLKGEEHTRILPALRMLESGDWLVPVVAGEPYYQKPPLVPWLVAGSFAVTGGRSVLAARLPSALLVLLCSLALVSLGAPRLPARARLIGALVFLTNVSVIEKGRLIEIEAAYLALTGLATAFWLARRTGSGSAWRTWLVTGALLGLGLLAKGPVLLLFFYLPAILVSRADRRGRELLSAPHALGVLVMLSLFLLWAVPAHGASPAGKMTDTWIFEMGARIRPADLDLVRWGEKVARSFLNFLPWLPAVPILFLRETLSAIPASDRPAFRAARTALAIAFLLVALPPGSMPRYSLPAFPLAAILLGWALAAREEAGCGGRPERVFRWVLLSTFGAGGIVGTAGAVALRSDPLGLLGAGLSLAAVGVAWRHREPLATPTGLATGAGGAAAVAMILFAVFAAPLLTDREKDSPVARGVNRLVPGGETLHALGIGRRKFLVYVSPRVVHLASDDEFGDSVRYLLIESEHLKRVRARRDLAGRRIVGLSLFSYRGEAGRYCLLQIAPP